jgi:hypothetical protein
VQRRKKATTCLIVRENKKQSISKNTSDLQPGAEKSGVQVSEDGYLDRDSLKDFSKISTLLCSLLCRSIVRGATIWGRHQFSWKALRLAGVALPGNFQRVLDRGVL